jgi:uncharacterized protein (TIGR03083 family)
MDATHTTDLLEETWRSVIALGRSLTAEDWELPTDCPGWTVKDHLSHLIGTERMLQGLPAADVDPGERPYVKNPVGQSNEREVELRRHLSGPAVLAEFDHLVAVRLDTLRTADAAYFAQERMTPVGPGTMLDFLKIRILDCWVHEQDMRRALGKPGHLDGGPAEHSTDRLLSAAPMIVGKRARAPDGATVVVAITGPVERTVATTVEGGRARFVEPMPTEPTVRVATDSETFLVLATGRQTATDRAGQITIEGDEALGQAIVDNLNIMF